jgi:outer membrane protein assembly factor BamB
LRPYPCLSVVLLSGAVAALAPAAGPTEAERSWPQWRGPLATGVAPHARPPLEWSETKNVRWKVEVPGRGLSTPIVWGDLVIVTAAVPIDKPLAPRAAPSAPAVPPDRRHPAVSPAQSAMAFQVRAYQRSDGTLRWMSTVREELPHEGTHKDGSYASGSALTDGEGIYAFFGSRGLYCLDLQGRKVWEKDLGLMAIKLGFGEGASPALHGDRLVVNWDHEGESFIVALDKKTGRELWRAARDEKTTWATPLVVTHEGKTQVITSASNRVRAYDLQDGSLLWEGPGLTPNAIPTPVHGNGLVYLTSGFRGNALLAVKLAAAKGDVANSPAIAWRYDQDTPYVPSPLLYDGGLYFLKSNSGILTRLDAASGQKDFTERVGTIENVYASPVAAAGRLYVVERGGATAVLEAGKALKLLATNTLEDGFDASPAVAGDDLFLRGQKYLYRISESSAPAAQGSPAGNPPAPQIAFPGQYAPNPAEWRFPVWPSGCERFPDEKAACLQFVASDFGRLGRFAGANAALAPPKPGEERVVFFGDSITDGWSQPKAGGFFPGRPYVNRGISGQTTSQMLLRFRPDVLALKPKAVVILAGTNDIAGNSGPVTVETVQENLASMAELAKAHGVRVVLSSVLPVSDDKKDAEGRPLVRTRGRPPATIVALNTWMAD